MNEKIFNHWLNTLIGSSPEDRDFYTFADAAKEAFNSNKSMNKNALALLSKMSQYFAMEGRARLFAGEDAKKHRTYADKDRLSLKNCFISMNAADVQSAAVVFKQILLKDGRWKVKKQL